MQHLCANTRNKYTTQPVRPLVVTNRTCVLYFGYIAPPTADIAHSTCTYTRICMWWSYQSAVCALRTTSAARGRLAARPCQNLQNVAVDAP